MRARIWSQRFICSVKTRFGGPSPQELGGLRHVFRPETTHHHDFCGFSTVFSTGVENFGERPNAHRDGWNRVPEKEADCSTVVGRSANIDGSFEVEGMP